MSLKVLSIDPGVKNLGWSIVSFENEKINLYDYGIMNLKDPPKCNLCTNPSFYFSLSEIEMIYCCEGHKESFEGCKKLKEKTIGELTDYLINKCDEKFKNLDFDIVVLENQPGFKNPHMKSIQMILFTYFKMRNKKVIIQNPCVKFYGKKFKCGGNKYKLSKNFSVECTKVLLKKKEFEKLKEYGKLDDICDAINHGVSYLCRGKDIPYCIKKIL